MEKNSFIPLNDQKHLMNLLFDKNNHYLRVNQIKGDKNSLREIKIKENELYIPLSSSRQNVITSRIVSERIFPENNSMPTYRNIPYKALANEIKEEIKKDSLIEEPVKEEHKVEEIKKEEIKPEKKYRYYFQTDSNSLIKLPKNLGTDDKDLKKLIDLMNESPTKKCGYQEVIHEKNKKVFKKQTPDCKNILIKSICHIPYSKDIIFTAIAELEIRKKWDTVFSELKVVGNEGENGAEILYMIIKSPFSLVQDRDFVQQRKIWKNFPDSHSHILHFVSVESPKCPIKKKCVRAETIISGYFIQDAPEGGSTLGIISQTDIKGKLPVFLVNRVAPKSSKEWIVSLLKGCQMIVDKKINK